MTIKNVSVNIREAKKSALDYLVAIAEGYLPSDDENIIESALFRKKGGPEKVVYLLIDEDYDVCAVRAAPYCGSETYSPSYNWELIGELFKKYKPNIKTNKDGWAEALIEKEDKAVTAIGETYLTAFCRAIAIFNLGEYGNIPEVLNEHVKGIVVTRYIIRKEGDEIVVEFEYLNGEKEIEHYFSEWNVDYEEFLKTWNKWSDEHKIPLQIML